jgi:hypothetical protein
MHLLHMACGRQLLQGALCCPGPMPPPAICMRAPVVARSSCSLTCTFDRLCLPKLWSSYTSVLTWLWCRQV